MNWKPALELAVFEPIPSRERLAKMIARENFLANLPKENFFSELVQHQYRRSSMYLLRGLARSGFLAMAITAVLASILSDLVIFWPEMAFPLFLISYIIAFFLVQGLDLADFNVSYLIILERAKAKISDTDGYVNEVKTRYQTKICEIAAHIRSQYSWPIAVLEGIIKEGEHKHNDLEKPCELCSALDDARRLRDSLNLASLDLKVKEEDLLLRTDKILRDLMAEERKQIADRVEEKMWLEQARKEISVSE